MMTETVFRQRVFETFAAMKFDFSAPRDRFRIPIYLRQEIAAYLRPVHAHFTPADVALMRDWRNQKPEVFLTHVNATTESTSHWLLEQILARPDRILFLVEQPDGTPFGQIGLTNFDFAARSCELDNWIRGRGLGVSGGMNQAIRALMDWTFFFLEAEMAWGRVFADNHHVLELHRRNGMSIVNRVMLRPIRDGDIIRWVETDAPNPEARQAVDVLIRRNGYVPLNALPAAVGPG